VRRDVASFLGGILVGLFGPLAAYLLVGTASRAPQPQTLQCPPGAEYRVRGLRGSPSYVEECWVRHGPSHAHRPGQPDSTQVFKCGEETR
jgi:hypothetical protein